MSCRTIARTPVTLVEPNSPELPFKVPFISGGTGARDLSSGKAILKSNSTNIL